MKVNISWLAKAFLCILFFDSFSPVMAQDVGSRIFGNVDLKLSVLEDEAGELGLKDILGEQFRDVPGHSVNLGLTPSIYWLKIEIANPGPDSVFLFQILNPNIDQVALYGLDGPKPKISYISQSAPLVEREINTQYPLYRIHVPDDSTKTFFLRAAGYGVLEIPIAIGRSTQILEWIANDQLYFGLYLGIIVVMSLYNLFLFLSIRDRQYLFYVAYILIVGLTQMCLKGYAAKFLWSESEWLVMRANHFVTVFSGIFAILFAQNFLRVKDFFPIFNRILYVAIIIHVISACLYIGGDYIIGQRVLQINTGVASVIVLLTGYLTFTRKRYRPALFFFVAWSFFLSSVIVFVLKEASILPYTTLTSNAILIGSALEAALLSFALADKINIYKKEKEDSQLKAVAIAEENERLVREQNIVLEQRVEERTLALKESNESLQETLTHLKETQSQLVEAEKMASLGQLTAGVAHEINNPINFVTSNVAPLKRDVAMVWEAVSEIERLAMADLPMAEKERLINDYKEELDLDYLKVEIDFLLKGMHEGATRTAEIVKSLRIFSRVDEDSLKFADINEGLESTMVILNSVLKEEVSVAKSLGRMPAVECYPGKLNQVFLNIITNAIYAVNKKFGGKPGGVLTIETQADETNAYISIGDNGIGMSEEVKGKMFEPFFTTKEVGEGTGLGMSIVFNTIKKHQGEIKVDSVVGEGSTFRIILPLKQEIS